CGSSTERGLQPVGGIAPEYGSENLHRLLLFPAGVAGISDRMVFTDRVLQSTLSVLDSHRVDRKPGASRICFPYALAPSGASRPRSEVYRQKSWRNTGYLGPDIRNISEGRRAADVWNHQTNRIFQCSIRQH